MKIIKYSQNRATWKLNASLYITLFEVTSKKAFLRNETRNFEKKNSIFIGFSCNLLVQILALVNSLNLENRSAKMYKCPYVKYAIQNSNNVKQDIIYVLYLFSFYIQFYILLCPVFCNEKPIIYNYKCIIFE